MMATKRGAEILGSRINALSWNDALDTLSQWAGNHESCYICICNVHSVVTARQDPRFRDVINNADMATPDGMPLAWSLRRLGFPGQQRINGPDLMWKYCAHATTEGQSIFLFGGTDTTLALLQERLRSAYPGLKIAGAYSPPFRSLSTEEEQKNVAMINDSGANVVFVSLGCPKQEIWMAEHRGRIKAVMIGVGAAFDYHAGTVTRAPLWMQNSGLEWLYRLISEPSRLWRRYIITNTLFVAYILRQFLTARGKTSQ